MTRAIAATTSAFLLCSAAFSQTPVEPPSFEVASVTPNSPTATGAGMHGCFGGPGSSDPILYRCMQVTVSLMAFQAYGLKLYQITPAYYADKTEWNVTARVPPGATADQVKLMLQTLLAERFKLAFHYDKKEMPGYDLTVAKDGPKLKDAAPPPEPVPGAPRMAMKVSRAGGLINWVMSDTSMDTLVLRLVQEIGRPVFDATGLKGKYDFTLNFASIKLDAGPAAATPTETEAGPTVFAALEKQLGLKLEPKKVTIDIFVLDHAEKTPTGN